MRRGKGRVEDYDPRLSFLGFELLCWLSERRLPTINCDGWQEPNEFIVRKKVDTEICVFARAGVIESRKRQT